MANRFLVAGLGVCCFCCGGRAAVDGSSSGAAGTTVAVGTGGGASQSIGGTAGGGAGGSAPSGRPEATGGGAIDWAACAPPDTCVLETETGCGAGCEPVPLSRFVPVNSALAAEYERQRLVPPCILGMCPMVAPASINTPNYYAVCAAGRCVGIDVRESPLSACTSDADCYLRSGTTCCGCGSNNLIAVSYRAPVEATFCGPDRACAADCAGPSAPPGVAAFCSLGHCRVNYPGAIDAGAN